MVGQAPRRDDQMAKPPSPNVRNALPGDGRPAQLLWAPFIA